MSAFRVIRALGAFLAVTVLQFVILIGLAMLGYGLAQALTGGLSLDLRDNLSLAAALAVPVVVGLSGEWLLKGTPLHWLRLSQNPIFMMPP